MAVDIVTLPAVIDPRESGLQDSRLRTPLSQHSAETYVEHRDLVGNFTPSSRKEALPTLSHDRVEFKKRHPRGWRSFFDWRKKLAVATVDGLALVLLAAPSSLLNEVLASLGESVAEVAAAAEVHLGKNFLNVGLNDHGKKGKK